MVIRAGIRRRRTGQATGAAIACLGDIPIGGDIPYRRFTLQDYSHAARAAPRADAVVHDVETRFPRAGRLVD